MDNSNTPIDYVIPFVNCNDVQWRQQYSKYVSNVSNWSNNATRFRDWDTLRYQLRSIEKYMPWVRNVYIVLSVSETQIPTFLNTECSRLHFVWDWEIVPQEYLPVFNSNVIDLFIPRIKDLSERYLYACDDYIVMNPLLPEDFYTPDGIKLSIGTYRFREWTYTHTIINSVKLICPSQIEMRNGMYYLPYCNHSVVPHLKSENLTLLERYYAEIEQSISRFRECKNLTWLIYPLSLRERGMLKKSRLCTKYHELQNEESIELLDFSNCDVIVLNDEYKGNFIHGKKILCQRLDDLFPFKSAFEK